MLALARRRLGDEAALHLVDLSARLPFAGGAFDDVVASLVLHYLEDWRPTPAELRRVLGHCRRLEIQLTGTRTCQIPSLDMA